MSRKKRLKQLERRLDAGEFEKLADPDDRILEVTYLIWMGHYMCALFSWFWIGNTPHFAGVVPLLIWLQIVYSRERRYSKHRLASWMVPIFSAWVVTYVIVPAATLTSFAARVEAAIRQAVS